MFAWKKKRHIGHVALFINCIPLQILVTLTVNSVKAISLWLLLTYFEVQRCRCVKKHFKQTFPLATFCKDFRTYFTTEAQTKIVFIYGGLGVWPLVILRNMIFVYALPDINRTETLLQPPAPSPLHVWFFFFTKTESYSRVARKGLTETTARKLKKYADGTRNATSLCKCKQR